MARTIGDKYKKMVKWLVKRAQNEMSCAELISGYVVGQMPEKAFDTWEGAYDEIKMLAYDLAIGDLKGSSL